jgi:peptidase C13-like protein
MVRAPLEVSLGPAGSGIARMGIPQQEKCSMGSHDIKRHKAGSSPARPAGVRMGACGLLLLLLLGLWDRSQPAASPRPARRAAMQRESTAGAPLPVSRVQWKALLLAGDDSITAFDHAIEALATLFQLHRITVVQQFSANPHKLSATVRLATVAQLRAVVPQLQVQPGEGCLVYVTSHGTRAGLTLARDPASGYRLRPSQLHRVVQVACGDAPTILVLSGCYTGTFLRPELRGPHRLILTAAAADRPSFGCHAEAQYTYYDRCFLRAFATAPTWQALHQTVSRCVAAAERQLGAPSSAPQAFFGRGMRAVPIPPA